MPGETFLSDKKFLSVMKSEIRQAAAEIGPGSDESLSEIRLGAIKRLIQIAEQASGGKERRRMVKDVLDVDYAQQLLNDGWSIQELADDFDFDYSVMKSFVQTNKLRKKIDRRSPTHLLQHIELETLIERIQSGETSREIALSLGDGFKASVISDFVFNHGSTMKKVREDATDLREAVEARKRKESQKQTRKQA